MSKIFFNTILAISFAFIFFTGCKPEEEDQPAPAKETGTVTDIDGNTYATIKIGNQWWMAENLKVTKYRNGRSIQNITDDSVWAIQFSGAYCKYDPSNVNTEPPGFLYNFYAVSDTGNLAPAGWHIATDDEWKELERHFGMSPSDADKSGWRGSHEGEKLKVEAPKGWTTYGDVWATNESGFAALAGSCRLFDGTWGHPGLSATGFWWSVTSNENEAWYRYLDYKNPNVFRSHTDKHYGFSVRCIKDY